MGKVYLGVEISERSCRRMLGQSCFILVQEFGADCQIQACVAGGISLQRCVYITAALYKVLFFSFVLYSSSLFFPSGHNQSWIFPLKFFFFKSCNSHLYEISLKAHVTQKQSQIKNKMDRLQNSTQKKSNFLKFLNKLLSNSQIMQYIFRLLERMITEYRAQNT